MLQHLIHRHVTRVGEAPAQLLQVEALTGLHHQAVFVEIDPGSAAQHQGGDGDDQHPFTHLWQLVEGFKPLGDDVLMGGEGVVGQGFPIGEQQHRRWLIGQLFLCQLVCQQIVQLLFEAQGTRSIGGDEQHRPLGFAGEAGCNQREAAADQLAERDLLARFGG